MLSAASGTLLGLSMLGAGWMLDYVEPRMLGFAGGAGFAVIALLLAGYAALRARMGIAVGVTDRRGRADEG
ncbi:hypothetical protein D3C80_1610110 [compost metagenome]